MDSEIIKRVKSSTVAIGFRNFSDKYDQLLGTGFIYDKRGYIVSAAHILYECQRIVLDLLDKGKPSRPMIYRIIPVEDDHWKFEMNVLDAFISVSKDPTQKNLTSPNSIDIGLANIENPIEDYPFLEIDNPEKLFVADEIIMCGYPMTPLTFSFMKTDSSGLRFSPIMQFGHISSLLPFDEERYPYGLQTDIVGTGGSSGSPIVNKNNGKVIGIAQYVLSAHTQVQIPNNMRSRFKNHKELFGTAQMGLVGGDSCYRMLPISDVTKDGFESAHGKMTQSPTSNLFFGKKPQ